MKQPSRIRRRAFCCIATIVLIVFGARFSAAADFGSPPAEHPSIIGTWSSQIGLKWTLVFKPDNTVRVTVGGSSFSAKYRIDYSTKPIHLDLFDIDPPISYAKDWTWRTILEFTGESRVRLETKNFGDAKVRGVRPEEFGKYAEVLTKEEVGAAAEHPSIIGTWVGHDEDGTKYTYVFKADNTLLRIIEGPKTNLSSNARYKIDYSTKPIHLDIFDFDDPSIKDVTARAILEFEGESRFRFSANARGERPEEFGKNAIVFTKEEVSAAAEHPSIIGTWVGHGVERNEAFKVTLVFKADNTMLWTGESSTGLHSFNAKYTIDYSTKPIQIDIFDITYKSGEKDDHRMLCILEFEGESRFRFIFNQPQSAPRPKEFTEDSVVFTKEEASAAAEHPSIIGTWVAEESFGADVIKITYVFKADNTMLWTGEMTGGGPKESDSYTGKYTIDYSTKPIQIDMFDITFKSGEKERRGLGILEFESESRVRFAVPLQFGDPRPKGFETGCMVFTKVE